MNLSLYKTVASAYLAKAIFIISKLIAIPLLLLHLSQEEYATFALLSALEGWFLLLDFGMGSSLQTRLASQKEGSSCIEKTAVIYLLISFSLSFLGLYFCKDLLILFLGGKLGITDRLQESFWITAVCLVIGTLNSVISKALIAKHKGHLFFIIQGSAHLLSLAAMMIAIYTKQLSLPLALILFWGIPNLACSFLSFCIFKKIRWKGPIEWSLIFKAKQFFVFSLMAAFVCLSDTWIVSRTLSLGQIIEYNILCKVFGIAAFAYAPILHSLIPNFSALFSENKVGVICSIIRKQCFSWVGFAAIFTLSVIFFSPLLERVFKVSLSSQAIVAFGIYLSVRIIADFYTIALQARPLLLPFFYLIPIQAIFSISFQYLFSLRIGIVGLLIGMSLSYITTVCWVLPRKLKKIAYLID